MLNEVRQRVTTCPDTGQVVQTLGASSNMHDIAIGMLLMYYITCIKIIHAYYGTFRGDFSIFKTLLLTHRYMNSANLVHIYEV